MPDIAVFIPGIMGSELRLGTEVIWPGPIASLLLPYRKMAQLLDPNLVATDVIRKYAFSTQYQALIDDLKAMNYVEDDRTLFVFAYDWRKPNEETAQELSKLLNGIEQLHGPGTTINLVAHSMGGLIARHYLESGRFTGEPGFALIRRLVTLGTPHRGAPLALIRILGQEKVAWLSGAQIQQASNDPRYPTPYQLLPPPSESWAWSDDPTTDLPGVDIYSPAVAQELGLVQSSLESARDFHATLDLARRPAHVRYFCFSGTHQTTTSLAILTATSPGFLVRRVDRDFGGDGTVPHWSSPLPGVQSLAVGGEHSVIYKDRELRRTLAAVLGHPDALGPLPFETVPSPDVDVVIRDRIVEPTSLVRFVLTPQAGVAQIRGRIQMELASDPTLTNPTFTPIGAPYRVDYQGPLAESLGLLVPAPDQAGGYRIAYYHENEHDPVGTDELFVQAGP